MQAILQPRLMAITQGTGMAAAAAERYQTLRQRDEQEWMVLLVAQDCYHQMSFFRTGLEPWRLCRLMFFGWDILVAA